MSDSTMLDITQINPVVRLKCYVDIIYYLTLIYSQWAIQTLSDFKINTIGCFYFYLKSVLFVRLNLMTTREYNHLIEVSPIFHICLRSGEIDESHAGFCNRPFHFNCKPIEPTPICWCYTSLFRNSKLNSHFNGSKLKSAEWISDWKGLNILLCIWHIKCWYYTFCFDACMVCMF